MNRVDKSVSVITPTWSISKPNDNVLSARLRERREVTDWCMSFIRKNAGMPFEWIVVANGDEAYCGHMCERQVQLGIDKLLTYGKSLGPLKSRMRGVNHASGDTLVFLDDDMFCDEGWLLKAVDFRNRAIEKTNAEVFSLWTSQPDIKRMRDIVICEKPSDAALWISRRLYDLSGGFAVARSFFRWERMWNALFANGVRCSAYPDPPIVEHMAIGPLRHLWRT